MVSPKMETFPPRKELYHQEAKLLKMASGNPWNWTDLLGSLPVRGFCFVLFLVFKLRRRLREKKKKNAKIQTKSDTWEKKKPAEMSRKG